MPRPARLLLLLLSAGCSRTPPAPVPDLPRAGALTAPAVPATAARPLPALAPSALVGLEPAKAQAPPRRRFAGGGEKSVRGQHGIVTSSEAQATRAGVAMLEQGGNAVDAAVATAFALAVTHPSAGNIGGGGFMLVRTPGGQAAAIDYRERAPAASTRTMYLGAGGDIARELTEAGYLAPGVPGTVRGLELA